MTAPDLVVVVPSRGRPGAARALVEAFRATCTASTSLVFALDESDPIRGEYPDDGWTAWPSTTMVEALNYAAPFYAAEDTFAVAFMGDDHRPRTLGWDQAYLDALRELGTGIVYGDDLLQGERLATQCAMTADIVRALGYMAPPVLTHLWVDNFWMALAGGADCLRYLPGVVVEHIHPVAGKAQWDENYQRVNSSAMYAHDRVAFEVYCRDRLADDIAKVKALRVK